MHLKNILKRVEGIGSKIAKRILRVIDSGFKTIKTDKYLKLKMDDEMTDQMADKNDH